MQRWGQDGGVAAGHGVVRQMEAGRWRGMPNSSPPLPISSTTAILIWIVEVRMFYDHRHIFLKVMSLMPSFSLSCLQVNSAGENLFPNVGMVIATFLEVSHWRFNVGAASLVLSLLDQLRWIGCGKIWVIDCLLLSYSRTLSSILV
jgi:hypothetical protein